MIADSSVSYTSSKILYRPRNNSHRESKQNHPRMQISFSTCSFREESPPMSCRKKNPQEDIPCVRGYVRSICAGSSCVSINHDPPMIDLSPVAVGSPVTTCVAVANELISHPADSGAPWQQSASLSRNPFEWIWQRRGAPWWIQGLARWLIMAGLDHQPGWWVVHPSDKIWVNQSTIPNTLLSLEWSTQIPSSRTDWLWRLSQILGKIQKV